MQVVGGSNPLAPTIYSLRINGLHFQLLACGRFVAFSEKSLLIFERSIFLSAPSFHFEYTVKSIVIVVWPSCLETHMGFAPAMRLSVA